MIEPVLCDDAILADVAAAGAAGGDALHLWWLGQSGFLVQWRGQHALIDPYLSDSLTRKYANTPKPHVRMSQRVIAPERLDFVDVVTSSHNHTDHLDADTLLPLRRSNPRLRMIIPEANRAFVAERLGTPVDWPIGLDDGGGATVGAFTFHAVPAAHETLERDEHGRCRFLGYVIQCGQWTIYHSGDTVRFDGMVEKLRRRRIDVAMLPINGKVGNMNGLDAALLARDIGAKLVIPCHYHMFAFNTADPHEQFVPKCERIGQVYRVLRLGERLTLG